MNVLAIFTCFNRKERTEDCIRTLVSGNPECTFTFVVVDDNSTDGTREILIEMKNEFHIHLLQGTSGLFYSGGMRLGMHYALNNIQQPYDYMLMMNDDVTFNEGCIKMLTNQSKEQGGSVVVGAMCDDNGQMSYSAVKYIKDIKYRKMCIDEWNIQADTFNANCVLIPYEAFLKTGTIDAKYIHSLGDFDYGLELKRNGFEIYVSKAFVGICNNNSQKDLWTDCSLNRKERLLRKESIKGAPIKQWFYFLRKNFGLLTAIKASCTPYLRIILGK